MRVLNAAITVLAYLTLSQCQRYTPYEVTSSEAAEVLQLAVDQQIDAYLVRTHKSKPPNPILAFVIAPNIDIKMHLIPRIVTEKEDTSISDLIFLAKIVCRDRNDCSQDAKLMEELRTNCKRIQNGSFRDRACSEVEEIARTKTTQ
jgi:hypothetical protein